MFAIAIALAAAPVDVNPLDHTEPAPAALLPPIVNGMKRTSLDPYWARKFASCPLRAIKLRNDDPTGCKVSIAFSPINAVGGVNLSAPATTQEMAGWSDKQQARRSEQYSSLASAHFEKSVVIEDDDLEQVATLHTQAGFKFKGGFTDTVRADSFLRAMVSKTTGRVIWQVYAILTYTGNSRRFGSANFQTAVGLATARLTVNDYRVECPGGICIHTDHLAFEVPEAVLRSIAERADQRPVQPWRFRFKSQAWFDWTDDIAPAEAAGLLAAVDRYRRERKLP
jgi:hypothetical protein